jgi:predicted MFS family arabinose efflux permease
MSESASNHPVAGADAPVWLLRLLAACCGLIVANLYYAQPLAGPIATDIGLSPHLSGLVVTLTQIGYGIGLLLIVPLADLAENRLLSASALLATALALALVAAATGATQFLGAAFAVGVGSVVVQILVPYAAHLSPESSRGRAVGQVMSGLLTGIMLARPVASFVTEAFGWRSVYGASAVAMGLLAAVLLRVLPPRRPQTDSGYVALLLSMADLVRTTPVLRRRALYQACLFGVFSLFWTVAPLILARSYGFSQGRIGLFALVGAAGAIVAPIAGRLADRGWSRPLTLAAILLVGAAFVLSVAQHGGWRGVAILAIVAILIDIGVTVSLIVGQRSIFMLGAEIRSRLNGLFIAAFFAGGAVGSAAGVMAYARGGWPLSAALAGAAMGVALLYHLGEYRRT